MDFLMYHENEERYLKKFKTIYNFIKFCNFNARPCELISIWEARQAKSKAVLTI